MLEFLADPQVWMSLLTLTALEIVLGIDNLIFLSIVSGRLPRDQQRAGGLFLIAKGTMETHHMLQGHEQEAGVGTLTFGTAVVEILLLAARARKKRRLHFTASGEIVGEQP